MSPRNILLLIIAVVFAAGTAMFVRGRMEAPAPVETAAAPPPASKQILVARRDIPAGSFVKAERDLEWAPWPENALQEYHIQQDSDDIGTYQGAVARRTVKTGEAITSQTLIKAGTGGFLSAVLDPDMRAVSVAVSPTSGTSGFIFPGDRVDVIVTHRVRTKLPGSGDTREEVVSETFIEDVRVVAVDQMLDNPENKAIMAKTVTVEVSADQAQKISVAEDMGKISFALRSLAFAPPAAEAAEEAAAEGAPKAEGGPLVPLTKETEDFLSAMTNPRLGPSLKLTRDSDISRAAASERVLIIRGDQSEQREFMQGEE